MDVMIKEIRKEISELQRARMEMKEDAEKTRKTLRNLGFNIGDSTEEIFFSSLEKTKKFAGIKFKHILRNIHVFRPGLQDEFDIVLVNDSLKKVGLIEIKHKVCKEDVDDLLNKKLPNFRTLHEFHSDYDIYLGLAGSSIEAKAKKLAEQNGIVLLTPLGKHIENQGKIFSAY